jgi:hypothetical protein
MIIDSCGIPWSFVGDIIFVEWVPISLSVVTVYVPSAVVVLSEKKEGLVQARAVADFWKDGKLMLGRIVRCFGEWLVGY